MGYRFYFAFLVCSLACLHAETLPPEFETALKSFRTEGTKGWGFTQSTTSRSQSMVETYDPSKAETDRWSLVEKNGKPVSESDAREYREKHTRRSSNETAPDVTKQLDLTTAERVSEDAERSVYRFHLKPGSKDDKSAQYMKATFTLHKPSQTIERIELGNTTPFSPVFAVKIQEAQTVITYSLPTPDRPTLLDRITVRVRGKAMFVKSLDEDMTVTYSDYHYKGKKIAAPAPSSP